MRFWHLLFQPRIIALHMSTVCEAELSITSQRRDQLFGGGNRKRCAEEVVICHTHLLAKIEIAQRCVCGLKQVSLLFWGHCNTLFNNLPHFIWITNCFVCFPYVLILNRIKGTVRILNFTHFLKNIDVILHTTVYNVMGVLCLLWGAGHGYFEGCWSLNGSKAKAGNGVVAFCFASVLLFIRGGAESA